jgi:hypothetical protein
MSRSSALILSLLFTLHAAAASGSECAAVTKPVRDKIRPSSVNPQYFVYNGRSRVLIGASASYLCHVRQHDTFGNPPLTPAQDYCEFTNYRSYMDNLKIGFVTGDTIPAIGLNKLRLWISLNSSPGFDRGENRPYDHESPLANDCGAWPAACSSPTWNLSAYSSIFFERLRCVLDYAWSKDIVVEITVFDSWQGNFDKSPWRSGFSREECFASKDYVDSAGKRCLDDPKNVNGWAKQRAFITKLAQELCSYPNIYYEVANEVDLTSGVSPTGQPQLTPAQVLSWHQDMTSTLAQADGACGHYIAANFHTPDTLNTVATSPFSLVNAHYTEIGDPPTRLGANELMRTRHNGGASELGRIFGFNETKITTDPGLFPAGLPNSFQRVEPARAEAWEFLMSEGGVYDLLGERWQSSTSDTPTIKTDLKLAHGFLSGYNLDRLRRSLPSSTGIPTWIDSGLTAYGGGGKRWAAMGSDMTQVGDGAFLYIHHSNLELTGFRRYVPLIGSHGPETLSVKSFPVGNYIAEWLNPANGFIIKSQLFSVTSVAPVTLMGSPTYSYDIALRITRR